MKKRKAKKRILSLEQRMRRELKRQWYYRMAQFKISSQDGKGELIWRATYATNKFLKEVKPLWS